MAYVGNPNAWTTGEATDIEREHVMDMIVMISPMRTPWLSTLAKMRAESFQPYFVVDELASYGDVDNGNTDVQAFSENTDADFEANVGPYRVYNYVHHFRETWSVSDKLNYVKTIDTDDTFASLGHKRIKEQARKIEFALYWSQLTAALGGGNDTSPGKTAPRMAGLRQIALHNGLLATDTQWAALPTDLRGTTRSEAASPAGVLSEEILGNMMSDMYDKGAMPSDIWCALPQKRFIADFTGQSTRNIEAADRALIRTIDVYEGPTGVLVVNLHPVVHPTELLLTETDLLEIAVLKPTMAEKLAKVGDAIPGMVETSLTLIPRTPAAVGAITDLEEVYNAA